MKKWLFLWIVVSIFGIGCSDNEPDTIPTPAVVPSESFNVNVAGYPVSLYVGEHPEWERTSGSVIVDGDIIYVRGQINAYIEGVTSQEILLQLDRNGNFISCIVDMGYDYRSYNNFPSHYFNVDLVELDEANHRIKLNFDGVLYMHDSPSSITAETREVEVDFDAISIPFSGQLDLIYIGEFGEPTPIQFLGTPIYCSANIDGVPWRARQRKVGGAFISTDPYKMEIFFASGLPVGSYPITPTSTDAYIKFSKFNTVTLQYDYYEVTGTAAYTYKEWHGTNRFSYIGTCNFTAVNPNDPSDVVQVTSGDFRTYIIY